MTDGNRITPRDIESKFREIQEQVDHVAEEGKQRLLPVAIAAGTVLLVVVYLIGRRSGKRRSTVVQIRRL
jgi:hypothetical protein